MQSGLWLAVTARAAGGARAVRRIPRPAGARHSQRRRRSGCPGRPHATARPQSAVLRRHGPGRRTRPSRPHPGPAGPRAAPPSRTCGRAPAPQQRVRAARDGLRVALAPRVHVAEHPLRAGLCVRLQPVAHGHRQPDPPHRASAAAAGMPAATAAARYRPARRSPRYALPRTATGDLSGCMCGLHTLLHSFTANPSAYACASALGLLRCICKERLRARCRGSVGTRFP